MEYQYTTYISHIEKCYIPMAEYSTVPGHEKMIDLPRRTSTYERPFTREGNYLVSYERETVQNIREGYLGVRRYNENRGQHNNNRG